MFQRIKSRLHELVTGDTLFRKLLFQKLLSIHELVQRVDRSITKIEHDIITIKRTKLDVAVFVLVTSSIGTMSRRLRIQPGVTVQTSFDAYVEIPAGAYVTVIGDGFLTDVTVGNMAQLMAFCEAPFCITRDPVSVGSRITVRVKGNFE